MDAEHLIGQKLLFAFHGKGTPSPEIIEAFQKYHPSGISFFRSLNIGTLSQVRELTDSLQRLARDTSTSLSASLDLPRLLMPYDLASFPQASAFVCTYSILEPSMRAVAKAVFGRGAMKGQLPVSIPGLYEAGHFIQKKLAG